MAVAGCPSPSRLGVQAGGPGGGRLPGPRGSGGAAQGAGGLFAQETSVLQSLEQPCPCHCPPPHRGGDGRGRAGKGGSVLAPFAPGGGSCSVTGTRASATAAFPAGTAAAALPSAGAGGSRSPGAPLPAPPAAPHRSGSRLRTGSAARLRGASLASRAFAQGQKLCPGEAAVSFVASQSSLEMKTRCSAAQSRPSGSARHLQPFLAHSRARQRLVPAGTEPGGWQG